MPSRRFESGGRRRTPTIQTMSKTAATMSTIATHVLGCDGVLEAATSLITNAATIPITSVALRAPT
jgi:hypothetical protein